MLRQSHTYTNREVSIRPQLNKHTRVRAKEKSAISNKTSETEDPQTHRKQSFSSPQKFRTSFLCRARANGAHFIFTLICIVHLLQFSCLFFFLSLAMDLYPARGAYHTRVCNINGFILFFRRQFFEWLLGPKHTILSLFFKRYKTLVIMVYVFTHVIYIFFRESQSRA